MRFMMLGAALLAAACGGGGDDFTPTLDEPWRPQSGEVDTECGGDSCIDLAEMQSPHVGPFTFVLNKTDNGPGAQWLRCFASFAVCWDGGNAMTGCVAAAECPGPCKDEYARLAGDATDAAAQATAFEAVFMNDDAPCRPPEDSP